MGNTNTNTNNNTKYTTKYENEFISNLRSHFVQNKPNKDKTKSKKKLPKCPICFNNVSKYTNLKNCNHLICKECINLYIKTNLKNISKYPLKCFMNNCDHLIDPIDVKYALNNNKNELFIFDKFSILCAISPKEREQCPQCDMVFFYQSKWQRQKQKAFKWIEDDERKYCVKCNKTFFAFIIRKHHCRICGEIYCDDCSNNQLPLSAASNIMLKNWVNATKSTQNQKDQQIPHNSTVKTVSKWIPNVTASSTSHSLSSDSSDKDNDPNTEDDQIDVKMDKNDILLSKSEEQLIENVQVRCCYACWLDYYRGVCAECDYVYCIKCRQSWHNNYDCDEIKKIKKDIYLKNLLNNAKNEELMLREGYRKCPGCNISIAKIEGCNHMTHVDCSNPNELNTNKTHFCYCCGELLYLPYHKYEKDKTLHFKNGVFENCRKYNKAKSKRDKQKLEIEKQINDVQNDLDTNNDHKNDDCIVM